ncbi:hypothetical protein ACRSLK_04480 [Halopseudomonas pachastrellae]|uniref:hypothetical protein n=1 Tax=Halopseudomonas pachastrellae TaxID=254161 RepID=UPI003D7D65A0
MINQQWNYLRLPGALLGAALLSACLSGGGGGGSDNGGAAAGAGTTVSGTAATGAAIVSGTVTAVCADGSGFTDTVTTDTDGSWSGEVSNAQVLPCALRINGGTPNVTLYSLATATGNVNITPLTDLALALQVNDLSGQNLTDWFSAPNDGSADLATLGAQLSAAADALRSLLEAAGYTLPASWGAGSTAPFSNAFTADPNNDPYDQLLEALAQAINDNPGLTDYNALVSSLLGGASMPAAPGSQTGGGSVPATLNAALVGSLDLVFKQGSGAGCGSVCAFSEDQAVSVVLGADNSLTINGKTLTNPINRILGDSPHLPEIIWQDGNIDYALSDNEVGHFNEINVGDLSNTSGPFNTPAYLGQLRVKQPANPATAAVGALAGTYTPTFVNRSSRFDGLALTLGDGVQVLVQNTGVVSIDDFEFDPSDPTFNFWDGSNSPYQNTPVYQLTVKPSEDVTHTLTITLDQARKAPVAWRVAVTTRIGSGAYSNSYMDLEERPLAPEITTLFQALQARSPITLTGFVDSTLQSGFTLCEEVDLSIEGDGSIADPWRYDLNPKGVTTPGISNGQKGTETFSLRNAYYASESNGERLAMERLQILLRDDGEVELQQFNGGIIRDQASTDPAQIAIANCEAFK